MVAHLENALVIIFTLGGMTVLFSLCLWLTFLALMGQHFE